MKEKKGVRFAVEEGEGPGEAVAQPEAAARSPQAARMSPPSGRPAGPSPGRGVQRTRSQEQLLRQAESIRRQLRARTGSRLACRLPSTFYRVQRIHCLFVSNF